MDGSIKMEKKETRYGKVYDTKKQLPVLNVHIESSRENVKIILRKSSEKKAKHLKMTMVIRVIYTYRNQYFSHFLVLSSPC